MAVGDRHSRIVRHVVLPIPDAEPSIMGMPHADTSWTAAMLAELPDDGNRYEVVDGELLVTPAPAWPHQTMIGSLHRRLANWLETHPEPLTRVKDIQTTVQQLSAGRTALRSGAGRRG